jgi:hypothetical protein
MCGTSRNRIATNSIRMFLLEHCDEHDEQDANRHGNSDSKHGELLSGRSSILDIGKIVLLASPRRAPGQNRYSAQEMDQNAEGHEDCEHRSPGALKFRPRA